MSDARRRGGLALVLALVLFATGAAAGIAVDRLLIRDPSSRGEHRWWERRRPEAVAERYRAELGLDAAQVKQVEEVLQRTWAATRKAFAPVDPEVDAIRRRGEQEIRELLRVDQRKRFDEMVAEQEARRAAMRQGLQAPPRTDDR